jgi:hypothetical protein
VFETGLETEWVNKEMDTGEMYVRLDYCELCDVTGLETDMNYEMEWNDRIGD